jgi:hypothetical protein
VVIVSKYLIPKGYAGLTLYPFVFLKNKRFKSNEVVLNHERIHLRQQKELMILPFYLIYGFEFLLRLTQYKNWPDAYRNISFEREAYENEKNRDYLKSRSWLSFIKYFRK